MNRYCVDGHEFDDANSDLLGDGQFAPFLVFDIQAQDHLPERYDTREAAEAVAERLSLAAEASVSGGSAMNLYDDVMSVEDDGTDDAALQRIINRGMWSLQGSFGRTMMAAIEEGRCLLGRNSARDYWGNFIPSRDQVKAGTKGSFEYVAERFGEDHAKAMAEEV